MTDQRCAMSDREYALAIYQAYREKVTHEDGLVNQRMFWLVTFQALLFTSFALLTQSKLEIDIFVFMTVIFALVGIGSATFTFLSVMAAFEAIEGTAKRWGDVTRLGGTSEQDQSTEDQYLISRFDKAGIFPALVGAPEGTGAVTRGKYTASSLPCLASLAWVAIVVVIVAQLGMPGIGA